MSKCVICIYIYILHEYGNSSTQNTKIPLTKKYENLTTSCTLMKNRYSLIEYERKSHTQPHTYTHAHTRSQMVRNLHRIRSHISGGTLFGMMRINQHRGVEYPRAAATPRSTSYYIAQGNCPYIPRQEDPPCRRLDIVYYNPAYITNIEGNFP